MPTRNTPVLALIIKALGDAAPHDPLERLENAFKASLLVVAGDLDAVARHAEKLRLAVSTDECAVVLDHLTVQITIDQVASTGSSSTGLWSLDPKEQRSTPCGTLFF